MAETEPRHLNILLGREIRLLTHRPLHRLLRCCMPGLLVSRRNFDRQGYT